MDWFTGIIVFLLTWWTVLFAVLPWGNKPPDVPDEGHAGSAPEKPRIKLKLLITTGISIVVWGIIYMLIEIELINFYEYARQMG